MEQQTKVQIVIAVIIIILFTLMGYVIKTQRDMIAAIENNNNTQQRYLKDNITAIQSTLLTNDAFNKRLASLDMDLNTIKDDVKTAKSKIDGIIVAQNTTPGTYYTNVPNRPSTIPLTDPPQQTQICNDKVCPIDTYGYLSNISNLSLLENMNDNKTQVPFGNVEFHPTKSNPWVYNILPRTYKTSILLATNDDGRKTAYAKMTIQTNGSSYDMPQTQVEFDEKLPTASFTLWNPRILLGIDAGWNFQKSNANYGMTAQVYISSYGKIKQVPDWYIGGVGLNYDINNSAYNLAVSPFSYKITSNNSIIQNISTAPTVGIDLKGNLSIMGGIRISL